MDASGRLSEFLYGQGLGNGINVFAHVPHKDRVVMSAMNPEISSSARQYVHRLYDPRYIEGPLDPRINLNDVLQREQPFTPICLDKNTGQILNASVDAVSGDIIPIPMECSEPLTIHNRHNLLDFYLLDGRVFEKYNKYNDNSSFHTLVNYYWDVTDTFRETSSNPYLEKKVGVDGKVYLVYKSDGSIVKLDESHNVIIKPIPSGVYGTRHIRKRKTCIKRNMKWVKSYMSKNSNGKKHKVRGSCRKKSIKK